MQSQVCYYILLYLILISLEKSCWACLSALPILSLIHTIRKDYVAFNAPEKSTQLDRYNLNVDSVERTAEKIDPLEPKVAVMS